MLLPALNPPSRAAAQDNDAFSADCEVFFGALPEWAEAIEGAEGQSTGAAQSALQEADRAETEADRAEAAGAFRTSFSRATRTELLALVGLYDGQSAGVYSDAGTHTDPVTEEADVPNQGVYSWFEDAETWRWIGTGVGEGADWAEITGKPSTFAPSSHTHEIADITGLTAALEAKAATGAVTDNGNTMATARLLGRVTAATGAIEQIELGAGLGFVDGKLAYTGGTSMVYPGSGIAVSSGSAWATSLAVPGGVLVGTTAPQTLTQKNLSTGTIISAGTMTGAAMTGGEIRPDVVITDSGTITAGSPGMRGSPIVSFTNRTLQASDMNKTVVLTGVLTINTGLPEGFICAYYNDAATAKAITIGGGVTLRHNDGAGTTGAYSVPAKTRVSIEYLPSNVVLVG